IARGRYLTQEDIDERSMVAVIGYQVAKQLFPFDEPLDNTLRVDDKLVRVVGVLAPVGLAAGAGAALIGRDLNLDIHIPVTTTSLVFGDQVFRRQSGSFQASEVQISEVYISAPSRKQVLDYAALAERIMAVRHPDLKDIGMHVPYQLLESAQKSAL